MFLIYQQGEGETDHGPVVLRSGDGAWYEHPDELMGLIRDPWVGGRPLMPDGLPVIDRLPG